MKSKSTPLFQTQQSLSVDCTLKLKNPTTSSCSGQKPPEHGFNPLLPTCIIGFIWIATASSFLAFRDPLRSIPKSSILYFSFSYPTCPCFSLVLIIPLPSARIYCTAPDVPKLLLMYDPCVYVNLSLSFDFSGSGVLIAPLFHKMHLQCPALFLTQSLCWTSSDFPSVHCFFLETVDKVLYLPLLQISQL